MKIYGVTSIPGSGNSNGINQGVLLTGITQGNSSTYLTTTGATFENSSNMFIVSKNKAVECKIVIVATTDTSPKYSASWTLTALTHRQTSENSVKLLGVSMVQALSAPELVNLQISLSENTSYGGLSIQCTGVSQYTSIKWIATITATEV